MYPHTITVINRFSNRGKVEEYFTVISNVHFQDKQGVKTGNAEHFTDNNGYIQIPYVEGNEIIKREYVSNKEYIPFHEWNELEEKHKNWTLKEDDFILKGLLPYDNLSLEVDLDIGVKVPDEVFEYEYMRNYMVGFDSPEDEAEYIIYGGRFNEKLMYQGLGNKGLFKTTMYIENKGNPFYLRMEDEESKILVEKGFVGIKNTKPVFQLDNIYFESINEDDKLNFIVRTPMITVGDKEPKKWYRAWEDIEDKDKNTLFIRGEGEIFNKFFENGTRDGDYLKTTVHAKHIYGEPVFINGIEFNNESSVKEGKKYYSFGETVEFEINSKGYTEFYIKEVDMCFSTRKHVDINKIPNLRTIDSIENIDYSKFINKHYGVTLK